jgi:hypothetical protein
VGSANGGKGGGGYAPYGISLGTPFGAGNGGNGVAPLQAGLPGANANISTGSGGGGGNYLANGGSGGSGIVILKWT